MPLFMTCRVLLALGLVMPGLADKTELQKKRYKPVKGVKLTLDSSLMKTSPDVVSHLNNKALSPWKYRHMYDEDRIPQRLSQAECLSSYCKFPNRGEDLGFESKPISYQTLVLRRIPSPGRRRGNKGRTTREDHVFRLESEIVTVGCTCVVPSIIQQDYY
ncbi:interleukin 17a/f3 [Osmerus eperlanus]|uniref:interleukin 17a/f3 n=1 Tax=Osmerus eperlanus TaxID=29151 RepID=UPI002E0F38A8